jgi:hypothetical protein
VADHQLAGLAGGFVLISGVLLTLSGIVLAQINTVVTTTIAYTDQAIAAIARLFAWMGRIPRPRSPPRSARSSCRAISAPRPDRPATCCRRPRW